MSIRHDIAIIGSGPAGITAAINGKIRNKDIIIFGNKNLSYKLMKSPKVNNYLGFYNITGEQLKDKFSEHLSSLGIEITEERVNAVYAMGDYFNIMVNEKAYEAKTVIIASGVEYTKPLSGEEQFLGKGVGYCATCDAPLYRDKTVTIVGYTEEAENEANYVNELAAKLYYIPMYRSEYRIDNNIEVIEDNPIRIEGSDRVEKLVLKTKEIKTDGVFVLRQSVSPAQLVPGLQVEGHIIVDKSMKTNIQGCFAAGDCTGKPYQYQKAAGEGLVAGLSAVEYLDSKK